MGKMKFAWLLPILQLALAFAFWEWPSPTPMPMGLDARPASTPMLIGYGISAPAIVIKLLVVPFRRRSDYLPISIGRFNIEDLIFFVGLFVLWHLIGRVLDRRMSSEKPVSGVIGVGKVLWDLALAVWGVFCSARVHWRPKRTPFNFPVRINLTTVFFATLSSLATSLVFNNIATPLSVPAPNPSCH